FVVEMQGQAPGIGRLVVAVGRHRTVVGAGVLHVDQVHGCLSPPIRLACTTISTPSRRRMKRAERLMPDSSNAPPKPVSALMPSCPPRLAGVAITCWARNATSPKKAP